MQQALNTSIPATSSAARRNWLKTAGQAALTVGIGSALTVTAANAQTIRSRSAAPQFDAQALSDRAAIEDVLHRYTTALDTKDWALLDQVFSPQGTADYSQVGGPQQLVVSSNAVGNLLKATLGTLITQHVSSNTLIELNGDSAKVVSYLIAQHWRKSDGVAFITYGRHVDTFVREASGWRVKTRVLDRMHSTGNPAIFGS
jgi:hypothetical protein